MASNQELIIKAKAGDRTARKQLVEDNVGLVWSIVRRYSDRGYEQEDLYQLGCIGLIKAIDRFDTSYNVMFSTYAIPMIQGEIKRFLRDDGMIKVSRIAKSNNLRIRNVKKDFENEFMREPTAQEISNLTGLTLEEIVVAMESEYVIDSLDKEVGREENSGMRMVDIISDTKNNIEDSIDKICLTQIVNTLDEKEKEIIKLRYYENMTQTQIAKIYGVSQVKISRMESGIIKKMRNVAGCPG